jgi:hypothetical protein
MWWLTSHPGRFTPGKETPVDMVQEAEWALQPVLSAENFAPTGIRSPDRPSRSESLYRLSHPGLVTLYNVSVLKPSTNCQLCKTNFPRSNSFFLTGNMRTTQLIQYANKKANRSVYWEHKSASYTCQMFCTKTCTQAFTTHTTFAVLSYVPKNANSSVIPTKNGTTKVCHIDLHL